MADSSSNMSFQGTATLSAPIAAPTMSLLLYCKAAVLPLISILQAFAHRHHNQHSSSHWWKSFSLFRRSIRNFYQALSSAASSSRLNNKVKPEKRNSYGKGQHGAVIHAEWLKTHVIPRAHLAFTQLAADNQHAPLGLLMLSVLARAHRLTGELITRDSGLPGSNTDASTKPMLLKESSRPYPLDTIGAVVSGITMDKGVLVPRDNIAMCQARESSISATDDQRSRKKSRSKSRATIPSSDETRLLDSREAHIKRKGRKKDRDVFSNLFNSL